MSGTGARGRQAAMLVALALVVLGVALALVAAGRPAVLPRQWSVPWIALLPVYLLVTRLSLEFQRRESSVGVTLVQLPLALGVVLVGPVQHLLARVLASLALSTARRQPPLKVLSNAGFATLEVGAVSFAVSCVAPLTVPGPELWAALSAGLLLGELVSYLGLCLLMRLSGMTLSLRQLVEPLGVAVVTTLVWAGLAIVTLAAAWTDRWTLLVVLGLAAGLGAVYRAHRRLTELQRATEGLYSFVKDLEPVDVEQPEALTALDHVRELLHARHLELSLPGSGATPATRLSVHLDAPPEVRRGGALQPPASRADLRGDGMSTPMVVRGTLMGLLSAQERVGTDRGFDMRDLRLLETVATELATALDRGRLLRDLGRAATTDSLTGLPNLDQTNAALQQLVDDAGDVLIAAVAVDSFREVKDTLGHQVADDLLREVARRLREAAPGALVGRTGGARFAVAVPSGSGRDAALFGLDLRSRVEGVARLASVSTHVRLAVGCARSPEHGTEADTLLRRAETALNSALHGHGGPVLWEPAYELQGQRRLALVMALREALSTGAVGVAYQPKVAAGEARCTGVEALARWTHPALGEIAPSEFVPLAETSGLMGLLTSTVLRQALTACRGWQGADGAVSVSVNVSADTLQDAAFVTDVARALQEVGVEPGLLTLELTEDVVVADPRLAAERMHELRALGVHLSVDDFGSGYSSLTYLKGLPIDEVKIDKGFVGGLVDDLGDQAVVRAVVDIAHTLGMRVVAEGVEHEDQRALLSRLGVDELQGYLYARPMPTAAIAAWLARGVPAVRPS